MDSDGYYSDPEEGYFEFEEESNSCARCEVPFKVKDKRYKCFWSCYTKKIDEVHRQLCLLTVNKFCEPCRKFFHVRKENQYICRRCVTNMCWKCGKLKGTNDNKLQNNWKLKKFGDKFICKKCSPSKVERLMDSIDEIYLITNNRFIT